MPFHAVLILLASPQTYTTVSPNLYCYRGLPRDSQSFGGFADMETDKDHHALNAHLSIWTPGLSAKWDIDIKDGTSWRESTSRRASLKIDSWALPDDTLFPIQVNVEVDGRSVGRFAYSRATTNIVDSEQYARLPASDPDRLERASSPGVELPESIMADRVWGAATVTLVTTDASGVTVDRHALAMPDWKAIPPLYDAAFSALERDRLNKQCKVVRTVTIID